MSLADRLKVYEVYLTNHMKPLPVSKNKVIKQPKEVKSR